MQAKAQLGSASHVLLACFFSCAHAWFDNGHMLVAKVAQLQMGPDAAARIGGILSAWSTDYPGMSDLADAAVWMDHIKCSLPAGASFCQELPQNAMHEFDPWHYADLSFNPDNITGVVSKRQALGNPSSVWALQQAVSTLHSSDSTWGQNFALRMLAHIVGDLHQPLHDAQGYFNDTRFGLLPKGDRGGNLIRIKPQQWSNIHNLHALWDAAAGLYLNNWPLSEAQSEDLHTNATQLMQAFPPGALPTYSKDDLACAQRSPYNCADIFARWAEETFSLAVSEVYTNGIAAGGAPSDAYLDNARLVSKKQITLAGYRLADVLLAVSPQLRATSPKSVLSLAEIPQGAAPAFMGRRVPFQQAMACVCVLQAMLLAACAVVNRRYRRIAFPDSQQALIPIDSDEESPWEINTRANFHVSHRASCEP